MMHAMSLHRLALRSAAISTLCFILMPLGFVLWLSFFRQEIPVFPPEGYSLRWFGAAVANRTFVQAFLLSLQTGVIATIIGLTLGVPAALALVRYKFFGREIVATLLILPLVVPGIVLGTATYVFHVEAEILAYAAGLEIPIIGSTLGLVAAHALIVIPWTVRLVTATLEGADLTIEEAAQNLGATPFVTFWRITLPTIRPGIVAASLFGFVASFGNLEMSLFLVGAGKVTLPIAILQYLEWKIDPTIAAVSVIQIAIIAGAMIITDRYVKLARVV
jgi:putative spermidine/putrescine transport system permease protein